MLLLLRFRIISANSYAVQLLIVSVRQEQQFSRIVFHETQNSVGEYPRLPAEVSAHLVPCIRSIFNFVITIDWKMQLFRQPSQVCHPSLLHGTPSILKYTPLGLQGETTHDKREHVKSLIRADKQRTKQQKQKHSQVKAGRSKSSYE